MSIPAPTPQPLPTSQPNTQVYTLVAIVVLMVIAAAVTGGVILTGHTDQASLALIASVDGSIGTIIVVLLNLLQTTQVSNKVQDVHVAVNSRMDQLINATQSSSFQAGQTAGPGAAVPPTAGA
jgi:hypothetical protein